MISKEYIKRELLERHQKNAKVLSERIEGAGGAKNAEREFIAWQLEMTFIQELKELLEV